MRIMGRGVCSPSWSGQLVRQRVLPWRTVANLAQFLLDGAVRRMGRQMRDLWILILSKVRIEGFVSECQSCIMRSNVGWRVYLVTRAASTVSSGIVSASPHGPQKEISPSSGELPCRPLALVGIASDHPSSRSDRPNLNPRRDPAEQVCCWICACGIARGQHDGLRKVDANKDC